MINKTAPLRLLLLLVCLACLAVPARKLSADNSTLGYAPIGSSDTRSMARELASGRYDFLRLDCKVVDQTVHVVGPGGNTVPLDQILLVSAATKRNGKIILVWPSQADYQAFEASLKKVLLASATRPSQFIFALADWEQVKGVRKRWRQIPLLLAVKQDSVRSLKRKLPEDVSGLILDGPFNRLALDQLQKLQLKSEMRDQLPSWLFSPVITNELQLSLFSEFQASLNTDVLFFSQYDLYAVLLQKQVVGANLEHYFAFNESLEDKGIKNVTANMKDPLGASPLFTDGVWDEGLLIKKQEKKAFNPIQINATIKERGCISLWFKLDEDDWEDATLIDNEQDEDLFCLRLESDGKLVFQLAPKTSAISHQLHAQSAARHWHHVAINWQKDVRTDKMFELYVNGIRVQKVDTKEQPGWFKYWPEKVPSFYLGGGHKGNARSDIVFEDLAVFSTNLNPGTINRIYRDGVRKSFYNWRNKLITE